jgi:hypothetical protein|tara:strand:+ start:200 stop:400 length:201 start_codon:yes stop_codon:yes gene_type:complete
LSTDIWDEVIKEYNSELDKLRLSVSGGQADSFAHYRQMVGQIHGIEWARNNLTNIIKKNMYDEEDD